MDVRKILEDFLDYLAPRLDTYEQAIYLYVFRHSRSVDKEDVAIGFKSSRRKMSLGIGEKGKPMAEGTCYEKLRSLQKKGCLEVLDVVRQGTRVKLYLPSEIPGLIPAQRSAPLRSLEDMDFVNVPENRLAIVEREGNKCFYCLRAIDSSNYVIEHVVVPGHAGDNSYRNVVASCQSCNNRKGNSSAEDFLRSLYRNGYLSEAEFDGRNKAFRSLREGTLRPEV
jgi:hypothetical protein